MTKFSHSFGLYRCQLYAQVSCLVKTKTLKKQAVQMPCMLLSTLLHIGTKVPAPLKKLELLRSVSQVGVLHKLSTGEPVTTVKEHMSCVRDLCVAPFRQPQKLQDRGVGLQGQPHELRHLMGRQVMCITSCVDRQFLILDKPKTTEEISGLLVYTHVIHIGFRCG